MGLRTPLYETHARAGAAFVEFAGYDMPVHYGSITDEHAAVRSGVGLFDVSHMSNLAVSGPGAAAALARVTPSDPEALALGKGKYTVLLRPDGTILDDTIYFRTGEEEFFVIPNAGRNEAVAEHLRANGKATVRDETRDWFILALQGPKAREVLAAATPDPAPKFHALVEATLGGVRCRVSGTGYTGEKGVEVYGPAAQAATAWKALVDAGAPHGIRPIGLGARDTLRLEKGYCLAGNEFEGGRTPLEANLEWTMDWSGDFLGRQELLRQKESGDFDRLWGLVQEKGIPRHGYAVTRGGGRVGTVTSGTLSPTRGVGIALAYLRGAGPGDSVEVDVRGRGQPAQVVKPPFV